LGGVGERSRGDREKERRGISLGWEEGGRFRKESEWLQCRPLLSGSPQRYWVSWQSG